MARHQMCIPFRVVVFVGAGPCAGPCDVRHGKQKRLLTNEKHQGREWKTSTFKPQRGPARGPAPTDPGHQVYFGFTNVVVFVGAGPRAGPCDVRHGKQKRLLTNVKHQNREWKTSTFKPQRGPARGPAPTDPGYDLFLVAKMGSPDLHPISKDYP
jgi:hypothetical protein